jgi:hypothetical protein
LIGVVLSVIWSFLSSTSSATGNQSSPASAAPASAQHGEASLPEGVEGFGPDRGVSVANVRERSLLDDAHKLTSASIVEHHAAFSRASATIAHFPNTVLGYVTPWNGHGYRVASFFRNKFSLVAPVWYQIKPSLTEVFGGHDVDPQWLQLVHGGPLKSSVPPAHAAKLVPRFLMDGWAPEEYVKLISSRATRDRAISLITQEIEAHGYHGITLEMSDAWPKIAQSKPDARKKLNGFVVRVVCQCVRAPGRVCVCVCVCVCVYVCVCSCSLT